MTYKGWYAIKPNQPTNLNDLQWVICHKNQPNQIIYRGERSNCRPKENNATALLKTFIEKINSGNLIM